MARLVGSAIARYTSTRPVQGKCSLACQGAHDMQARACMPTVQPHTLSPVRAGRDTDPSPASPIGERISAVGPAGRAPLAAARSRCSRLEQARRVRVQLDRTLATELDRGEPEKALAFRCMRMAMSDARQGQRLNLPREGIGRQQPVERRHPPPCLDLQPFDLRRRIRAQHTALDSTWPRVADHAGIVARPTDTPPALDRRRDQSAGRLPGAELQAGLVGGRARRPRPLPSRGAGARVTPPGARRRGQDQDHNRRRRSSKRLTAPP